MQFEALLSRINKNTLQELLGSGTVRLLQLLDPSLTTSDRLREILLRESQRNNYPALVRLRVGNYRELLGEGWIIIFL